MRIAVASSVSDYQSAAQQLAENLALPFSHTLETSNYDALLVLTPEHLALHQLGKNKPGPIFVDFMAGVMGYRREHGGGRRQALGRAIGLKPGVTPYVIDATAGFGRDAFILAALGCKVLMLERSAIIHALLADGLRRAKQIEPELNLDLLHTDAKTYLQQLNPAQYPDVIYLDPMFPHRTKSALVKKELRLIRSLVGDDPDASDLLHTALNHVKHRIVVKRPRLAPPIADLKPPLIIHNENSRFDVYLTKI